jgi:hypothetical protein
MEQLVINLEQSGVEYSDTDLDIEGGLYSE